MSEWEISGSHRVSPTDTVIPMALLGSYPASKMTAYKVSTRVGSPKNNDAEIIVPVS